MNRDNKINEDLFRANVDLVDKNKELTQDNKNLRKNINNAIEYILNKSEEYKPGYRKVNLNTKECSELMDILESEFYEW